MLMPKSRQKEHKSIMSNITKNDSAGGKLMDTASDAIKSGNPVKIVGGIALAVAAVGGYAIHVISQYR